MLKGHVFENQLFGNPIFAVFVNTFLAGENGIIDGFGNSMQVTTSGSTLTIQSGVCCIQGRFLQEDTSSTITAGDTPAYARLVLEIDLDKVNTENDFQQGYYKIITNSTTYPSLTQDDIVNDVSGVYQFSLGRFQITSNGIAGYADERTFLDFDSIYEEIREKIHDIEDESIYVLKEDLEADYRPKGERLWTNSSPTNSFAAQTITFTENDYDYYRIGYRLSTDRNRIIYQDIKPGDNFDAMYNSWYTPGNNGYIETMYRSHCSSGNSSIHFSKCIRYMSSNPSGFTEYNADLIPVLVDGYYI